MFVVPVAIEIRNGANTDFAAFTLRKNISIIIKHLHFDQGLCSWPSAGGLFQIVIGEIAAAHAIRFGKAITQQRIAPAHFLTDFFDMIHGAWGAASREGRAAGKVIFVTVRVRREFNTHQRNANEIADAFLFDDAHGFFRIPFGHQYQLASNGEALQNQWN